MGIRGLNTFIKKVCPEAIKNIKIDELNGKTVAIDSSILLYKYRYVSNINNEYSHIIGFINRVKYYKKNNITPIFVFDGIPPKEKKITLEKRQMQKVKIKDKIKLLEELNNSKESKDIEKEIEKLSNQVIYVTKNHILEVKKVLDYLGIIYFDAPDEAEKYCVFLQNENIVDYIVSDDTDCLTFGANKILKTGVTNIVQVDKEILMNKLQYTNEKFVDFCILSGCDYCNYIPGVAINTVFTLFKKLNNIEEVKKLNKYKFDEESNYDEIRKIFLEFNYNKVELENKTKNIPDLIEFLIQRNITNYKSLLKNL